MTEPQRSVQPRSRRFASPPGELSERVAALCKEIARHTDGTTHDAVETILDRLSGPIRVAVAGRVSAGKSTLVNALLGTRVARTGRSECTHAVTTFRWGASERIELAYRDGRVEEAPLDAFGRLPESISAAADSVIAVTVWLSNERLKTLTLIDTPGLSSAHDEFSALTMELLDTSTGDATKSADALAFVFTQSLRIDDLETLRGFRADDGMRTSAANVIGVLSHADTVNGGVDPIPIAADIARHAAQAHEADVSAVVPLVGLLAETGEAHGLHEAHVRDLHLLTEELPRRSEERKYALMSADHFRSCPSALSPARREELLELLGPFGLEVALGLADDGTRTAHEINRTLSEQSGFDALQRRLIDDFESRSDVLKADAALSQLERLAGSMRSRLSGANVAILQDGIEEIRLRPEMHVLRELDALRTCAEADARVSEELRADLARLFRPASIAERLGAPTDNPVSLRDAALDSLRRWRTWQLSAGTSEQEVAATAIRSLELILDDLAATTGPRDPA